MNKYVVQVALIVAAVVCVVTGHPIGTLFFASLLVVSAL